MAKTVSLPEVIFEDLASVSEELASMARKPTSSAMTISMLIAVYRAHLSEPCARDAFRQRMRTLDFMSPKTFEKAWDYQPPKTKRKQKEK
jgi:hypothetical protein